MDVNSLPKTVTRQRRGCDLNPGPFAPESSTLTTRLPSHPEVHAHKRDISVLKSEQRQTKEYSALTVVRFSLRKIGSIQAVVCLVRSIRQTAMYRNVALSNAG